MTYVHPAWLEHQRKRFTRADAYRFAPPGSPEAKPPGWLDPSATRVRLKEAQEKEARARAAAEQEAADAVFAAKRRALQASQDELWRMLAEVKYELAWRRLVRKYSPDQPRDERGRWTDSGGGASADSPEGGQRSDAEDASIVRSETDPEARVIQAGGITKDQLNLTVQTFVSTFCVGSINRQLPGQFMGVTIAEVMTQAQQGNSAARMCLKLLMQDRFRK